MSVFIVIPAIITISLIILAFLLALPQLYTLCNTMPYWSSNQTASALRSPTQDQAVCNNNINEIFFAVVGAVGAVIIWAIARVGKNDENFG